MMAPNLSRSALTGVAANWAGSGVLVVAQIASTAATARLVAPHEFGVYATAQAASGLAGYFTMKALASGLVRRAELGPKTIGTAAALSLISSAVVTIIVCLAASPWAHAWGVPGATGVVRVVALTLFLSSVATVPLALMQRRLRFGLAATIEAASQVFGLAAGVALAVDLHSALALAVGQTLGAFALLMASGGFVIRELQVAFDRDDARELFAFAGKVNALGFSSYVSTTAPSWFAARAFGASLLGVYSRANLMIGLPVSYLANSITSVLYPLYGRVRSSVARTRVLLDEGLTLTIGFAWPAFAFVAGAAPILVRILLGARWHAAAPLVSLCALAACASLPCGLLTNAAEAFNWMRPIALRQLIFFIGIGGTLVVVWRANLSLDWLVAGVAVSQWLTYALTLRVFVQNEFLDAQVVLERQALLGVLALLVFAGTDACSHALRGAALLDQLAAQIVIMIGVLLAAFAFKAHLPQTRILERRIRVAWADEAGLEPTKYDPAT